MIKGAKTIAEYKIRKWIEMEIPDVNIVSIEVSGDEWKITDSTGDSMILVYDEFNKTVHEKEN